MKNRIAIWSAAGSESASATPLWEGNAGLRAPRRLGTAKRGRSREDAGLPPHSKGVPRAKVFWVLLLLVPLGSLAAWGDEFDARSALMDELMFHAQRYGNTTEKQERKEQARAELFARGTNALYALMGKVHLDNVGLQVLTQQLVEQLQPEEAQPVLVDYLSSAETNTRKIAAFFLSLNDRPTQTNYAAAVMQLLDNDETAGAALRALGKWKVDSAVSAIEPFLKHEREPRRVAAANALRDIGDPSAVPALMGALDDPYFTVRETAARALTTLGKPAETALLECARTADGQLLRHCIRALGEIKSEAARPLLNERTAHPDSFVAFDAKRALDQYLTEQP